MRLKRLLASTLAVLALSVGLAVAQPAPASALCANTRVYNGSGVHSFFYKDQYGTWRTLRPRATSPTNYIAKSAQVPFGRAQQVYYPWTKTGPVNFYSGVSYSLKGCAGVVTIITY